MTDSAVRLLMLATALGCGLVAGVFFAFSSFVMKGLSRLPPAQGIAAMQSINITAITPAFMTALFGTAAACVLLAVHSLRTWPEPRSVCLTAAAALYMVGTILVTMGFHVPRNNALAVISPTSPEAPAAWARYSASWTAGNHVRACAALAASALIVLALCYPD